MHTSTVAAQVVQAPMQDPQGLTTPTLATSTVVTAAPAPLILPTTERYYQPTHGMAGKVHIVFNMILGNSTFLTNNKNPDSLVP